MGEPASDGWAGSVGGGWVEEMSSLRCHLLTSCLSRLSGTCPGNLWEMEQAGRCCLREQAEQLRGAGVMGRMTGIWDGGKCPTQAGTDFEGESG